MLDLSSDRIDDLDDHFLQLDQGLDINPIICFMFEIIFDLFQLVSEDMVVLLIELFQIGDGTPPFLIDEMFFIVEIVLFILLSKQCQYFFFYFFVLQLDDIESNVVDDEDQRIVPSDGFSDHGETKEPTSDQIIN